MAEKYPDSGPESSPPIPSSQSNDEQSLENDGNSQSDSRRRKTMLGSQDVDRNQHHFTILGGNFSQVHIGPSTVNQIIQGHEGHPPTESSSSNIPGDEEKDEGSKNEICSSSEDEYTDAPELDSQMKTAVAPVVISGGNYSGALFGPQTNKRILKADDYRNAKITNIHYHHYLATEGPQESLSSTKTGARPKQGQKSANEYDVVQISDDLFMYTNQPLQEGTNVYKGYQLHASGRRRPLAIKRIVPCEDSHLREVEHLLTLASHPNIVQIIQSKHHSGYVHVLFIAMELCSSQNLRGYLDKNREKNVPFDFDQAMSFTKQLVSGMRHIHRNRIVHRDLKPENILVSEDGQQIKVSDFGLSKRLRLGQSQTRQTRLGVGTDGYRAPETFVSETIGTSADIFSLGAIMYSMWSNGKHPFGNDIHLVNYNIRNNKGRDLSGILISGTKENQLRNLIDWMLHPDPKKRPTIEQVAQHAFFKSGPSSPAEGANPAMELQWSHSADVEPASVTETIEEGTEGVNCGKRTGDAHQETGGALLSAGENNEQASECASEMKGPETLTPSEEGEQQPSQQTMDPDSSQPSYSGHQLEFDATVEVENNGQNANHMQEAFHTEEVPVEGSSGSGETSGLLPSGSNSKRTSQRAERTQQPSPQLIDRSPHQATSDANGEGADPPMEDGKTSILQLPHHAAVEPGSFTETYEEDTEGVNCGKRKGDALQETGGALLSAGEKNKQASEYTSEMKDSKTRTRTGEGEQQLSQQPMDHVSLQPSYSGPQLRSDTTVEVADNSQNAKRMQEALHTEEVPVDGSSGSGETSGSNSKRTGQRAERTQQPSPQLIDRSPHQATSDAHEEGSKTCTPSGEGKQQPMDHNSSQPSYGGHQLRSDATVEGSNSKRTSQRVKRPQQSSPQLIEPSPHQATFDASGEGHFGPPSLPGKSQSNPNTQKNDSSAGTSKKKKLSEGHFGSPSLPHNPQSIPSTQKNVPEGNHLIELKKGVFCNKKVPLCERAHVYQGEQRNGKGIPKTPLAVKIFYCEEGNDSSSDDENDHISSGNNSSEKYSNWFRRYRHELKNMVALDDHKHLTKFKSCGKIKGEKLPAVYIAMGLCHVTTLAHINLEKVAPDQRRNIFSQICHGLEYLHSDKEGRKPVAHMDLKPGNILFSINGRTVMLADFGLSKEVDINKKGNQTTIKKSSTSYGGSQGWMAAEMLLISKKGSKMSCQNAHGSGSEKPDYLKADVFSLGLVGIYTMYNKHPFADPVDETDDAFWHVKIKQRELPNFEQLKDDHLVQDLFEKMLSHNPDERPSIQEVLQHSMFWDPTDQITFLKEIYGHYFENGKFKKKHKAQTDEKLIALKVAYVPLSTVKENPDPTVASLASLNSAAEAEVVTEMTDVFGQCWLDRVEEMDKKRGTKVYKKKQRNKGAFQDYSLSELLRYIRNHLSHALGMKEDRKRHWALHWVEAFPKLIPYLLKIMEPVLTPEDRKKFIQKRAEAGDIDLSHLLGDMP